MSEQSKQQIIVKWNGINFNAYADAKYVPALLLTECVKFSQLPSTGK